VIGIIALLISILLPALNKARKAATTLQCESNLRTIGQVMQIYASEWRGAIIGSRYTTGAFLVAPGASYTEANCPELCCVWDWQAPVAKLMKANFDTKSSLPDRTIRFQYLCTYKPFVCPENDIISPSYSASPIKPSTQMISYNTNLYLLEHLPFNSVDEGAWCAGNGVPRISNVGTTSLKAFMFDGGKYCSDDVSPPDYNEGYAASETANDYADYGPASRYSRAFGTTLTPINVGHKPTCYTMRHGVRKVGAPLGSYRMNVVFFDGHAETLDAKAAANPVLWFPKGTTIFANGGEISDEAINLYVNGGNGNTSMGKDFYVNQ
jgi:prepilin-type processing-associated H-X9-DG protein